MQICAIKAGENQKEDEARCFAAHNANVDRLVTLSSRRRNFRLRCALTLADQHIFAVQRLFGNGGILRVELVSS